MRAHRSSTSCATDSAEKAPARIPSAMSVIEKVSDSLTMVHAFLNFSEFIRDALSGLVESTHSRPENLIFEPAAAGFF